MGNAPTQSIVVTEDAVEVEPEQPTVVANSNDGRSTFKNGVYASILDSAVETVTEASNSVSQIDPMRGLSIFSGAASTVSGMALQGLESVNSTLDKLMEGSNSQPEQPAYILQTTTTTTETENGEQPPTSKSAPTLYSSIYSSASSKANDMAATMSQLAFQGIETVTVTLDGLNNQEDDDYSSSSSSSSEAMGDIEMLDAAFDFFSTTVSEVANLDYVGVSSSIFDAVKEFTNSTASQLNSTMSGISAAGASLPVIFLAKPKPGEFVEPDNFFDDLSDNDDNNNNDNDDGFVDLPEIPDMTAVDDIGGNDEFEITRMEMEIASDSEGPTD